MPDIKNIPDEVKWRLAARCASMLPLMYDHVFRTKVGKDYDSLEQEIWIELSQMVNHIIRDLSFPVATAHDLAVSLQNVTMILFGPEYKGEVLDVSDTGAVILVKRCPFLAHTADMGISNNRAFTKCMALSLAAIPRMNKKYSIRYVRTICTGDRQCEMKIEEVPETVKKDAKE